VSDRFTTSLFKDFFFTYGGSIVRSLVVTAVKSVEEKENNTCRPSWETTASRAPRNLKCTLNSSRNCCRYFALYPFCCAMLLLGNRWKVVL
jgi:hypothetical protein